MPQPGVVDNDNDDEWRCCCEDDDIVIIIIKFVTAGKSNLTAAVRESRIYIRELLELASRV